VTGLVYLAIIALWVVFLIPWLSRHRDEQNGRRSADRYHRAMDTLARAAGHRRSTGQADAEVESEETSSPMRQEDEDEDDDETEHAPSSLPGFADVSRTLLASLRATGPLGRGRTAKRRRRVIALLGVALAGAVAAAVAGLVPGAAPALVGGLLVVYLTIVVRQVVRSAEPAGVRAGGSADRHRAATAQAQRQARGLLTPPPQQQGRSRTWEAVPTTLPTYVSKPKASKVPRVVDLTSPGRRWTGEAMVQQAQRERRESHLERAQQQFDREMAVLEPDPTAAVEELANAAEPAVQQRPTYRRAANG